jgi:hypothetical protein
LCSSIRLLDIAYRDKKFVGVFVRLLCAASTKDISKRFLTRAAL